jgi:hypothetical protein
LDLAIVEGDREMARYQILYWGHIPLGVKATDINGTVRVNLPARFQEAFQRAATGKNRSSGATYTTSSFRWSEAQVRDGSAQAVATAVAEELDETWSEKQALASFDKTNPKRRFRFLDLKRHRKSKD